MICTVKQTDSELLWIRSMLALRIIALFQRCFLASPARHININNDDDDGDDLMISYDMPVTMASPPPTDVGCASQTSPSYYTHTHTYSHSINYPIGSRLSNNPFLQRRRSLASSIYTFQYSSLDDEIHEKQNGTSRNEDSRSPLPPRRSNRLYSIVIITTGILLPSHATTISRSIINH